MRIQRLTALGRSIVSKAFRTTPQNVELFFWFVSLQLGEKFSGRGVGRAWIILNPLLQLIVFLAFFAIFFQAKWGQEGSVPVFNFIIGLIFYWATTESLAASVTTIKSNKHLISKVVFPVTMLPVANIATCVLTFAIQVVLFVLYIVFMGNSFGVGTLLFLWLFVLFVAFLFCIGFLFAWLGAAFEGLSHLVPNISLALMFLSPIFYSIDALPQWLHPYFMLNPLSFFIEVARSTLLLNQSSHSGELMFGSIIIALSLVLTYKLFAFGKRYYPNA